MSDASIAVIGAFDSKGDEFAFLIDAIRRQGGVPLTINFGVLGGDDRFRVDVAAAEVARVGGSDLAMLRAAGDRGAAMQCMAAGSAVVARQLFDAGRIAGIIGMGGSGGTSVITAAMRALPTGVPKVCVSTVAGGDVTAYVGTKDITMIPSVTDVAGLNRFSRVIFTRAAGAVVGMVRAGLAGAGEDRPLIAATMFGNTTPCVDACRGLLEAAAYEVVVFHATGVGGRAMESLIDDGLVDACLDITTTEWADQLCGGVFSAGTDRLSAAGRRGIPHLIVPGCLDMVNFGPPESVPQKYRDANRIFLPWNPAVTLMRTNVEENRRLGEILAAKANAATGPVAVVLPLQGLSLLGAEDQAFCDPLADQALFAALRQHLAPQIPLLEINASINDRTFAEQAVRVMLELIGSTALRPSPSTGIRI